MLTVMFATATSALFGVADFLGGLASRRDHAFIVTANAHVIGLVLLALAAVVFPHNLLTRTDVIAGAIAGVAGGVGVFALYAGLAAGRMSVVAPLTAALSGSLPAIFDVFTGNAIGWFDGAGLALALCAIIMVSISSHPDDPHGMPPRAIALALLSGTGFAGSFVAFSFSAAESGYWPLVIARVVSVTLLGGMALISYRRVLATGEARKASLSAGALDAVANVTMISAIRIGPLAVASVFGSLYPVATVLLARVVLAERVTPLQRAGIALAMIAVVMTAIS